MVGLTISGKIYKRQYDGSINAEKLLVRLEHLVHHIRSSFILIWNRSRTYKVNIMKAFLEKHPEFLWSTYPHMLQNSIQKSIVIGMSCAA